MVKCHVCGKEKKPYTVFMENDIFSLLQYHRAREDGEICERCDRYHAMTGEFKDATNEEFEIAKKSAWFANMMMKWWIKDKELTTTEIDNLDENKRDWEGTALIAKWCREKLTPSETK